MPVEYGAFGVKVAVDVLKRPATKGIAWAYTTITGRQVLILGPARAGKSSFRDFLRYGVLETEQPTQKTVETQQTTAFRVSIGRDESLVLKVRSAIDVPGQVGPMEHAKIAEKRRPHAIVVMLDLSAPWAGDSERATAKWLIEFCNHLEERLRSNKTMLKRLKGLIFVANKSDTQTQEALEKRISDIRRIIAKNLDGVYATKVEAMPIMPCILIQHEAAQPLAEAVIIRLAKMLSE